jgi:hypothetical protein
MASPAQATQTAGSRVLPPDLFNLKVLLDDVGKGIRSRLTRPLCDSVDWDPNRSNGSCLKRNILDAMYIFYRARTKNVADRPTEVEQGEKPLESDAKIESKKRKCSETSSIASSRSDPDRDKVSGKISEEILPETPPPPPMPICSASRGSFKTISPAPLSLGQDLDLSMELEPKQDGVFMESEPEQVNVQITLSSDGETENRNLQCRIGSHYSRDSQSRHPFIHSAAAGLASVHPAQRPDCLLRPLVVTVENIAAYIRHHWRHQAAALLDPVHLNVFDKVLGMFNQW